MARAGRPLYGTEKRKRVSFTLAPPSDSWLLARSSQLGISKSELVDKLILAAQTETLLPSTPPDALTSLALPLLYGKLDRVCRKYHVKSLSLFGSQLKQDNSSDSDVDLLVQFEEENSPSLFEISALTLELEHIFQGKSVDLRTAPELSKYFRDEVEQQAVCIYGQ